MPNHIALKERTMPDEKSLALIPQDLNGFTALAKQFAESKLIPSDLQGKAADVFVTLLAGNELGLSPMASLRGIHVVKGKPVLSADTMVGVVLASGAAKYFRRIEATNERATYETWRNGDDGPRPPLTWTAADAVTAGLSGDNWKKYPRAMLAARCKAELARDVYPDVLAGCYVDGEIDDGEPMPVVTRIAPPPVRAAVEPPAIDAEIVDTSAEVTPWSAFLADLYAMANLSAATEDDVNEAWCRALDCESRAEIDTAIKGISSALSKHKGDFRVTALREKLLASYKARIGELKARSAS